METGMGDSTDRGLEPDMELARRKAHMAHLVVVKLKEMGLPDSLDSELASLSTDLGDLWSTQKEFAGRLEGQLKSHGDWEEVADYLVDLRAEIDHIEWHLKSVRRPLNRLTHYAYRKANKPDGDRQSE